MIKPTITDYLEVWLGTISPKIIVKPSYTHVKSIFDDKWYNLVIPTTPVSAFNWHEVEALIQLEKQTGVEISIYLDESRLNDYREILAKRHYQEIGTDTYLHKEIDRKYELNKNVNLVTVTDDHLDAYISVAKNCFGEWPNEEKYILYTYNLPKVGVHDPRKNLTYLIIGDTKEVQSFGSIVFYPKRKLGYIHNTGTHADYRRQGLFLEMVKYLINQALLEKIETVFAIVEKDEASYHGFKKLGFKQSALYYLFEKVK